MRRKGTGGGCERRKDLPRSEAAVDARRQWSPGAATTLCRDVEVVRGIRRVRGVAGVLALVLAETVAGAATLTWVLPLWNETKRSYFTLWSVLTTLLFAWPAWFAASSGAVAGTTGRRVTALAFAVAVVGTAG